MASFPEHLEQKLNHIIFSEMTGEDGGEYLAEMCTQKEIEILRNVRGNEHFRAMVSHAHSLQQSQPVDKV